MLNPNYELIFKTLSDVESTYLQEREFNSLTPDTQQQIQRHSGYEKTPKFSQALART